jgi:polyhydroxyalkanoate depolymerase
VLYRAYDLRCRALAPVFQTLALQSAALRAVPDPLARLPPVRASRAAAETLSALQLTHRRPSFGVHDTEVGGDRVRVREEVVAATPFADLLRFTKDVDVVQPAVLVVPGLAGHFGTLVRGTVRTLLPDHDVYLADWRNARDVPLVDGRFGLDEFVQHLIDFLAVIGPGAHLMAVCQPCVPVLTAAAVMAEDDHPAAPAGLILMAGPVDARINPGRVNHFANRGSLESLERRVIQTVPGPHAGAGRRVYPGFLQAMGFLGLAPRRHASAFAGLFRDVLGGDDDAAHTTRTFYDEYFAVLDIAAEFYLETARAVFREHDLARGTMQWRGRRVDPAAIRSALLTVEAGQDQLCPPGQTHAAHALCTGIPAARKRHHLQPDVGHYGVFSGSRFERRIYPEIRDFVAAA